VLRRLYKMFKSRRGSISQVEEESAMLSSEESGLLLDSTFVLLQEMWKRFRLIYRNAAVGD
jgi:hypothetical protein